MTNFLDILVGNAQYTLIKQHKNYLRTNTLPQLEETNFIFDQHMAESMNKIINRMKKLPYERRWVFHKPKLLPTLTTRNTWAAFMRKLMQLSLNPFREVPINISDPVDINMDTEILLSSQLDSDEDLMEF